MVGLTEQEVADVLPQANNVLIIIDKTELQRLAHHECSLTWIKSLTSYLYNNGVNTVAIMSGIKDWGILAIDGIGFHDSLALTNLGLVDPINSEKGILDYLSGAKKGGTWLVRDSQYYSKDTLLNIKVFYNLPFHTYTGEVSWN